MGMSRTYELPEPSGEVTHHDVMNSYGTRGCFRIGTSECENPDEDVRWAAQYLADALAAQDYRNSTMVDRVAMHARAAYHNIDNGSESDPAALWGAMSDDYRDRWRAVVRAVLEHG